LHDLVALNLVVTKTSFNHHNVMMIKFFSIGDQKFWARIRIFNLQDQKWRLNHNPSNDQHFLGDNQIFFKHYQKN
jgi:hypothetical protein